MRTVLFCMITSLFFICPVSAITTNINLNDLIAISAQANPDIYQARLDVEIADAKIYEKWANMLIPSVRASMSYNYSESSRLQNQLAQQNTNDETYTNIYRDNASAGISLSKTLFNWFQDNMNLNSQSQARATALKKLSILKKETTRTIANSYYQLMLTRNAEQIMRETYESTSILLNEAEKNRELGQTSELDVLTAKLSYKNSETQYHQAVNNRLIAERTISTLTGLPAETEFIPLDSLAILSNNLTNLDFQKPLIPLALSNDSELAALSLTVFQADITRKIMEASRYPTLSSSFSYKWDYDTTKSVLKAGSIQPSWSVGLQISMPVDDYLFFSATSHQIQAQEKTRLKAISAETARIKAVTDLLYSRFEEINSLKSALSAQNEKLNLARQNLALARRQKIQNQISDWTLKSTEISAAQAELDYYQALYNLVILQMTIRDSISDQ